MTARRLATILDVVGYSRLVSADEADERLTARRCPLMSDVGHFSDMAMSELSP